MPVLSLSDLVVKNENLYSSSDLFKIQRDFLGSVSSPRLRDTFIPNRGQCSQQFNSKQITPLFDLIDWFCIGFCLIQALFCLIDLFDSALLRSSLLRAWRRIGRPVRSEESYKLLVAENGNNRAHTLLLYRLCSIPVPQALTSFNCFDVELVMMRRDQYLTAAKNALTLCAHCGYRQRVIGELCEPWKGLLLSCPVLK